MKKTILCLSLIATILFLVGGMTWAATDITVKIDGKQVMFPDTKPFIQSDSNRTMVPIRFIAENLGCEVDWIPNLQLAFITKDNKGIKLRIGESTAEVNGEKITFDAPPIIKENRTFVPLRFISETLNAKVEWSPKTKTIDIITAALPEETLTTIIPEVTPVIVIPEVTPVPAIPEVTPVIVIPQVTPVPVIPEVTPEIVIPQVTPVPVIPEVTPEIVIPQVTPVPVIPEVTPVTVIPQVTPVDVIPEVTPVTVIPQVTQTSTVIPTPIVIDIPVEDDSVFKEIFAVDPEYQYDAHKLSKLFEGCIEKGTLEFNFEKALDIVKNDTSLTVVGTLNQTICKDSAQVSVMVDELIKILQNVGVKLTPEIIQKYTNTISGTFTNLEKEEDKKWIIWSKTKEHSVTYTYNIFFAIKNAETGRLMAALPIGLTITADCSKQKFLGITLKDKQSFNINVKAIHVAKILDH